MDKQTYIKEKEKRREQKRTEKRVVNGEEVIFIFEKVLEGWKTIRIYNTIIKSTNESCVKKKKVKNILIGNYKIYKN